MHYGHLEHFLGTSSPKNVIFVEELLENEVPIWKAHLLEVTKE